MSRKNTRRGRKNKQTVNTSNTEYDTNNTDCNSDNTEQLPHNPEMGDVSAFTFGDPEPVLDGHFNDYAGVFLDHNGEYYQPPVSLQGLARLLRANAYHGPILEFKTNVVMRGFEGSEVLKRRVMYAAATDYNVFLNCYFQRIRNGFGETVDVRHLPAINMRKLKEPGRYGMLNRRGQLIKFRLGEVVHIKNYDVNQTIYGVPWYLGAIQSMLLNEDATLFRRKYYLNGAHVGYIFYSSSAGLSGDDQKSIKQAIKGSRGLGNFRNMFLHIPNGREKDIQILPVGDFSTKDELEKIKNISRDDIIAAHRQPAALAAVLPSGNSNFGDISKVDPIYEKNEIIPIREQLETINDWLPEWGRVSFSSPLLES
ncbi:phage portal protein [Endozoicomonas montiporae]|uniref:PBSX family phage portal protein n=1 Tax=Endozoicomonas montiporae CL-33 TaxID=570277 RepID=A0A142BB50_9GAMM|nr:phage portal protein [Endozoicomonas montiporae]AMO55976.1 PBSX family phage portal protein [Endozoicomonas montiporae CL-33]